jgi:transposase-like protein
VLGVQWGHVAIHDWVHKATLQPISAVTADQVVVDEKMIRVNGAEYWLYGAVDPEPMKSSISVCFADVNTDDAVFLAKLHRRCQLGDPDFLVGSSSYLDSVLKEGGYRFQVISNGDRNAVERVFCKIEQRTPSFANSFSHVTLETAQSWLEALAVHPNSRQD